MFRRRQDPPSPPPASEEPSLPNRPSPRSPSEAIKPTVAPPPPEKPERRRGGLLATISGFLTLGVVLALGVLVGLLRPAVYSRNDIAGMTDRFAMEEHRKLQDPHDLS